MGRRGSRRGRSEAYLMEPVILPDRARPWARMADRSSLPQGVTVRVADLVEPPAAAEITADVEVATGAVETLNGAVVLPAETVTVDGTVATVVLELFKVTTVPPGGAGPFKVTVADDGLPPVTVVGFRTSESTAGALTVSVSVLVTPA